MGGTGLLCADRIGAPAVPKSPRSPHRRVIRQFHRRLRRPTQLRYRIPLGLRIHQLLQLRRHIRVGRLHRLAARAPGPHPPVRDDPRLQFRRTATDRDRRGPRDQGDPTKAVSAAVRGLAHLSHGPGGSAQQAWAYLFSRTRRTCAVGGVDYIRRVVDGEVDDLLPDLAAISLDGPKGGSGRPRPPAGGSTWCSGWTTAPITRSSTPT